MRGLWSDGDLIPNFHRDGDRQATAQSDGDHLFIMLPLAASVFVHGTRTGDPKREALPPAACLNDKEGYVGDSAEAALAEIDAAS